MGFSPIFHVPRIVLEAICDDTVSISKPTLNTTSVGCGFSGDKAEARLPQMYPLNKATSMVGLFADPFNGAT
jgi:hypothetical protein